MPIRALRDTRCEVPHVRVLGLVAHHGRSGNGCWASLDELSKETALHRQTVYAAIRDLLAWDYLREEPSKTDGRRRILFVIFDEPVEAAAESFVDDDAPF